MDSGKVDMFMLANAKFFESHHLFQIREQLLAMDDSKWGMIQTIPFKDPTTSIIVSILAGHFGIDRFIIAELGAFIDFLEPWTHSGSGGDRKNWDGVIRLGHVEIQT